MSQNLSQKELFVYNTIRDYLGNRRPFVIDKLIPIINSKSSKKSININSKGIKQIIKKLLNKKMILEGSILTKDEILQNEVRKKIHDYVKKNSVAYFYQIMKDLDLPTHSVIWHLNLLHLFGFLEQLKIEEHYNHYIYYANSLTPEEARAQYFIKNEKCKEIINILTQNNEGHSKTRLSKQLGMHHNTITKYLNQLEIIGIIKRIKQSNRVIYQINRQLLNSLRY